MFALRTREEQAIEAVLKSAGPVGNRQLEERVTRFLQRREEHRHPILFHVLQKVFRHQPGPYLYPKPQMTRLLRLRARVEARLGLPKVVPVPPARLSRVVELSSHPGFGQRRLPAP